MFLCDLDASCDCCRSLRKSEEPERLALMNAGLRGDEGIAVVLYHWSLEDSGCGSQRSLVQDLCYYGRALLETEVINVVG